MKITKQQRGVTLLELMIVVAIVGIFAAIGMPSMTSMVNSNRLNAARGILLSDLNLARSEAIKRNARVLVCSGNLTNGCTNQAAWAATGWVVCYDMDKDGACDANTASNPNPFMVRGALAGTIAITGPTTPVAYHPIGSVTSAANFVAQCQWSGAPAAKTIAIAMTGFATVK